MKRGKIDTDILDAALNREEVNSQMIEDEWKMFNKHIEDMCKHAVATAATMMETQIDSEEQTQELCADLQVLLNKLHKAPDKGTDAGVTLRKPKDKLTGSESTVRSRTSRKMLARLFEVKRCAKLANNFDEMKIDAKHLAEKLMGRKLDSGDSPDTLLIWAQDQLDMEHQKYHDAGKRTMQSNLRNWRRQIQAAISAVSRFVNREAIAAPDITHKGEVLETMQEVVEAISDHWRTVWENKDRDLRAKGITFQEQVDIVAKELEALGPPPLGDWKDPDGERVLKAFRNSGGSASADGWQGEEVKHFPAGVANKFAIISKRWKKAKYAPVVLKAARQANLIKESKICKKTNTLEARDTRPISVSSIWWRVYTTCWITCEELSHWRMHYFPEDVVFAENAKSCGAKVCDKFRELGFLGTLDFSQCYDHVDPRLITEVLKRLHFPSDLADLLQDVWGKLIRYIQWNGHTGAVPLDAGKALM